jgi:glucose-1-phosphate thymidylyltransferase
METKNLKGIILAGGTGSRLEKLTSVINKHLIAVGKVPMIEYPLATLRKIGANDITVVTGADHAGSIMNYLTKEHPKTDFTYKVQKEAGGIAQALKLTENVVYNKKIAVILGDNIFDNDYLFDENFEKNFNAFYENNGCLLFLKKVRDPGRFGVAEISDGKIISIEEKPKEPKSNLAVTGLYFYDETVFDKIRQLKPSARGEYEISHVNELYVKEGKAFFTIVKNFWSDAGTHESRKKAEDFIYAKGIEEFIGETQ